MPSTFQSLDQICPHCQGTDLHRSKEVQRSEEYQGILRRIECENCGAAWDAIYRIGGYTNLTPKQ